MTGYLPVGKCNHCRVRDDLVHSNVICFHGDVAMGHRACNLVDVYQKQHGPNTDPCGTPDTTESVFDVVPPRTTAWDLFDK